MSEETQNSAGSSILKILGIIFLVLLGAAIVLGLGILLGRMLAPGGETPPVSGAGMGGAPPSMRTIERVFSSISICTFTASPIA